MILTGATAALYCNNLRIGKCRQISLDVAREALPTTKQGDIDRTFISGLRDTKGSASLYYDPSDPAVDALMTKVFTDSGTLPPLDLIFDTESDVKFTASVVLTSASITTGYGTAQVCEIQFQMSGKPNSVYVEPPIVPPTPAPGSKWLAYTTENETATNTHSVILDNLGNTYVFTANQTSSELVKLSATGNVIWIRRFTSYNGQFFYGTFGFPGVMTSQTIHRINDNLFLCCIADNTQLTHFIGVDSNGSILYNKAYKFSNVYNAGNQNTRVVSADRTKLICAHTAYFSYEAMTGHVIDTATGQLIKRFRFTNIESRTPWFLRNVIQKPNGNWVFYVTYDSPYYEYFIETNAEISSVAKVVEFRDLSLSSTFLLRPDAAGYLVLGSSYIFYLSESFELLETRKFFGSATSIQYDSNGDYYLWANYTSWYQDIGIPGWPDITTLIKYNWDQNYVYYVTMLNTYGSVTALNKNLQRMSFAPSSIGLYGGGSVIAKPYRLVGSFDLIQPSAADGTPLSTTTPPGFTVRSRTVLAPTTRPTIESLIYTRNEYTADVISLSLISEQPSSFVVESVTRTYNLVTSTV